MPRSVQCLANGIRVLIDDALRLRDNARKTGQPVPDWRCVECRRPVRPYKASPYGAAHFEHWKRNPNCSLSDQR